MTMPRRLQNSIALHTLPVLYKAPVLIHVVPLERPSPADDFRLIETVLEGVIAGVDLLITVLFLRVSADTLQFLGTVNHVDGDAKTIDLIFNRQLRRCVDVAFLLVPAHVEVVMVCATIREAANKPRVAVEVENDRLVNAEKSVEIPVGEAVRVFSAWLQLE